jgi:hypothetical protein
LETDSLTVELTPLKAGFSGQLPVISSNIRTPGSTLPTGTCKTDHCSLNTVVLLRFLVRLVLTAAVTKLLELETAGGRLLILGRRVIALLALSALQCDDFPHLVSFQCSVISCQ